MSYIVKRGTSYQARWRQPDGSQRSRTFDRKRDAQLFLARVDGQMADGAYRDPAGARMPFGAYAREWLAAQMYRTSTEQVTRSRLERHVLPTFGDRRLGSIRPTEVQAWVRHLADPDGGRLAPSTTRAVYVTLASIMRAAVADGLLPSSPCQRISLPAVQPKKVEPLAHDTVQAIRAALPDHLAIAVTIGAGAGLRISETLGLTVDRVDFLRRMVTVDRQLQRGDDGTPVFGPPKTRASVRTVPLPQSVVDALSAHLARFGEGRERLIVHRHKRVVPRQTFGDHWQRRVVTAPTPDGKGGAGIAATTHDLRHYCASVLIDAGCSVKVVQEQLGHASAVETLDTYSHLWPADHDRVRAALDAVLLPARSQTGR